jgi:hypothetical protein
LDVLRFGTYEFENLAVAVVERLISPYRVKFLSV